ncbi:MAG: lysylphosphatidylglycerol synthase domain-containing protein, partial [Beijerinckiaceae bacterium]|nr:lysylphosphatidylglycerol synthase domain-containing protein [Beijerinckiaceae bacterium]
MPTTSSLIPDVVRDKKENRRRIRHLFAVALSIGIFVLAAVVVVRTFTQISFDELRGAIASTGGDQIATAFLLTAVSFLALTGYDALALRQLKLHVPYPTTALASFTSYAISFTLGFPLITAGTVRYWIYSGKGLSGGKVASLTIIAGLTFWLGMALLIGIGFAVRANGVANLDHLDPLANRLIGIAIILALVGYLAWAAQGHRHAKIQGFRLELPGFWLTVGQLCLGLIDLCAASGVLFVLLSPPRAIDYLTFITVYVFGSLLGIASNAPGGIGVFEATMLKTVPAHSEAALLASLLLFRIIYYLVPFVLALAMLGAHESIKR